MSNVGFDTFFPKTRNTYFIVKNVTPYKKRVRIFNYPVEHQQTRDLLTIPEVSEADIRHALLKGQLKIKIEAGELLVVASNIDLLQFDLDQKSFLQSAGITNGLEVSAAASLYPFFQDVPVLGTKNSSNLVFTVPDIFIYNTDYKLTLYLNGVRQNIIENYLIAESGGPGSGYDTVVFINPPRAKDVVVVDYFKA
jgi:hypothetical protein